MSLKEKRLPELSLIHYRDTLGGGAVAANDAVSVNVSVPRQCPSPSRIRNGGGAELE